MRGRSKKNVREASPQTCRSMKKVGRRCSREIPLQPLERTVVMQVVNLKLMEDCGGADTHSAAEDPTPEHGEVPQRKLQFVESPCWSRLLTRPPVAP